MFHAKVNTTKGIYKDLYCFICYRSVS